jgi:hypothetical protein
VLLHTVASCWIDCAADIRSSSTRHRKVHIHAGVASCAPALQVCGSCVGHLEAEAMPNGVPPFQQAGEVACWQVLRPAHLDVLGPSCMLDLQLQLHHDDVSSQSAQCLCSQFHGAELAAGSSSSRVLTQHRACSISSTVLAPRSAWVMCLGETGASRLWVGGSVSVSVEVGVSVRPHK